MKGYLKDRPLEAVFHDVNTRALSGVLTLARGTAKKQICFLKGIVRFAASNLREDRLGEFLIRRQVLSEDAVRAAEQQLLPGQRFGEALLEWGAISPTLLHSEVRGHILDIVMPCYEWRDGEYRFQEGVPDIIGEVAADIPTLELALERARRQITDAQVEKIVSEQGAAVVPSGHRARDLPRVKLTTAEAFVLAQAEKGVLLSQVRRLFPDGGQEIARAVAALSAADIVSLAPSSTQQHGDPGIYDTFPPGTSSPLRRVSEAAPLSAEMRYFKQMHTFLFGADHYKTLNIEVSATDEVIRHSYYSLAKEIHPDRFLEPPRDILHKEMEELFAQVLEAYNTLINPATRAQYDAQLQSTQPAPKPGSSDQQILAKQNFLRGRALYEEGKMIESLKFLQSAVDLEPNRADYRRLLGSVQTLNPRLRREAEEHFLKAIELDPARADTYLQLGLLYRRLGDIDKAVETLKECLKWDPSNVEAGGVLAELSGGGSRS